MKMSGLWLAAALLMPAAVHAAERPQLTLMVENDSFIDGIDRHYTNGLYVARTGTPGTADALDGLDRFAARLMLPPDGEAAWRSGWFAGQNIYTPGNLYAYNPPSYDRPYAGWLYGGRRLYRDSGTMLDRVEVTLGFTGPIALAGDVQKWWHAMGLLGGIRPNGWHTQLRDEPGLVVSEQRIVRVKLHEGRIAAELLPEANLSLGNVFTYAAGGATVRIGQGLAADWGPPRIAPALEGAAFHAPDAAGWYIFAGVEGRLIARNIFLDGNSFHDSARVDHHVPVADLDAGAVLFWPGVRLTASYAQRTHEFVGQRGTDQFMSFSLGLAD
jgi:hypothetical protein